MTDQLDDGIQTTQQNAMLDLYPQIKKVAHSTARVWQGSVDVEDLIQDIGIRLLNDKQAIKIWSLTPAGRAKGLGIIARQIASEQRETLNIFTGQFNYTTKEVRSQLGQRALTRDSDYEMTEEYSDFQDGEPVASSSLEIKIENIDLRAAFPHLSKRHQQILLDEYSGDGWQGEHKDITEAVDALTRFMNRNYKRRADVHDGPGSRKVKSNASSRRATQRNY